MTCGWCLWAPGGGRAQLWGRHRTGSAGSSLSPAAASAPGENPAPGRCGELPGTGQSTPRQHPQKSRPWDDSRARPTSPGAPRPQRRQARPPGAAVAPRRPAAATACGRGGAAAGRAQRDRLRWGVRPRHPLGFVPDIDRELGKVFGFSFILFLGNLVCSSATALTLWGVIPVTCVPLGLDYPRR